MVNIEAAECAVQQPPVASNALFASAVRIIEARIGLISNNQAFTTADEFLPRIPFSAWVDTTGGQTIPGAAVHFLRNRCD
jgi:hypothetical protein